MYFSYVTIDGRLTETAQSKSGRAYSLELISNEADDDDDKCEIAAISATDLNAWKKVLLPLSSHAVDDLIEDNNIDKNADDSEYISKLREKRRSLMDPNYDYNESKNDEGNVDMDVANVDGHVHLNSWHNHNDSGVINGDVTATTAVNNGDFVEHLSTTEAEQEEDNISYSISNVKYTSQALLRRLKVWRSSKGFKTPKAPFNIKGLQNFFRRMSFEEGADGDKTIAQLPLALLDVSNQTAEASNANVGWVEVLQLLRDCEGIANSPKTKSSNTVECVAEVDVNGRVAEIEFNHDDDMDTIARQVISTLKEQYSMEISNEECLQSLITSGNPWQRTIEFLQNELSVAQDLILSLEQMMLDHHIQQVLREQERLKEKENESFNSPANQATLPVAMRFDSPLKAREIFNYEGEFSKVDTDKDGKISKEEWRGWMSEKLDLINDHNKKMEILANENKFLRSCLNPDNEKHMENQKRLELLKQVSMEHQASLKEENWALKAAIDSLKDEIAVLKAEKLSSASPSPPSALPAHDYSYHSYSDDLIQLSKTVGLDPSRPEVDLEIDATIKDNEWLNKFLSVPSVSEALKDNKNNNDSTGLPRSSSVPTKAKIREDIKIITEGDKKKEVNPLQYLVQKNQDVKDVEELMYSTEAKRSRSAAPNRATSADSPGKSKYKMGLQGNRKDNVLMVQARDTTGFRSTSMTPVGFLASNNSTEFHVADEMEHIVQSTVERSKKAKHPLRTALKAMIAEKKGKSSHCLGSIGIKDKSVPLSKIAYETTEKLRVHKAITSRAMLKDNAPVDHMRQTHASVLKKKEISNAGMMANIKTFSGWKSTGR